MGLLSGVMHERQLPAGRKWMLACGLLAVPVLYIPFRIVAQRYNTATIAGIDKAGNTSLLDNFVYPFAIIVWPAFTWLCGLLTSYISRRFSKSWVLFGGIMVVALVVTYLSPWMDGLLGIDGGGLDGFVSWPSNRSGMNTPELSAIMCPVLFGVGAVAGAIVGDMRNPKGEMTAKSRAETKDRVD